MRTHPVSTRRPLAVPIGGCAGRSVWVTAQGIELRETSRSVEPSAMTIEETELMIGFLQRGIGARRAEMARRGKLGARARRL